MKKNKTTNKSFNLKNGITLSVAVFIVCVRVWYMDVSIRIILFEKKKKQKLFWYVHLNVVLQTICVLFAPFDFIETL